MLLGQKKKKGIDASFSDDHSHRWKDSVLLFRDFFPHLRRVCLTRPESCLAVGWLVRRRQLLPRQVPGFHFCPVWMSSLQAGPCSGSYHRVVLQIKSKGTWEGNRRAKMEVPESGGSGFICVVLKFSARCNFKKMLKFGRGGGAWLSLCLPELPGGCPGSR